MYLHLKRVYKQDAKPPAMFWPYFALILPILLRLLTKKPLRSLTRKDAADDKVITAEQATAHAHRRSSQIQIEPAELAFTMQANHSHLSFLHSF